MPFQTAGVQRVLRWVPVCVLLLLVAAGCGREYPQSTLDPHSDFTRMVDGVFMGTVWWATGVFLLVEGALVYAILRFRARDGDAEPNQVHGNTTLEIIWTIIPALILAGIAVPTVRAIFRTYEVPTDNAFVVEVVGHQWWWEFRYPEYKLITANELHVPIGRTVALKMITTDVIHSFWTPKLAAKRDVFPNRSTTLWFKAETPGLYPGQCAEFCGLQHGRMGFHVVAQSPNEFGGYIRGLQATGAAAAAAAPTTTATLAATTEAGQPGATPVAQNAVAADGAKLFLAKGCVACHSLDANKAVGIGPNLANVGSRKYIGAGRLRNTDENLARWIQNPQVIKQGVLMPNLGLTEAEATTLAAYLRTHK